jgi:hypothetical protein
MIELAVQRKALGPQLAEALVDHGRQDAHVPRELRLAPMAEVRASL